MSYLTVFIPSLVLTLIVGFFLAARWKPARTRRTLAFYWGAAFAVHLGWWALPHMSGAPAAAARWLAIAWIGAVVAATLLIVPFELFAIARRFMRGAPPSGARTAATFVSRALVAGISASLGSTGSVVVREEQVVLPGLPAQLDGMRIANIADVHIGRFSTVAGLNRVVDASNARKADLFVVTGDPIDDLSQLGPTLNALERSRALPVVAVLGNHDKMGNLSAVLAAYKRHAPRVELLVNSSLLVERGGAPLRMVGVDYALDSKGGHMLPRSEQEAAMRAFASKAFARVRKGETVIALSHHPDFFPFAAQMGARLTLAGHTHGGQVKLFGRPVIVAYDHMHGLYKRGDAYLDVSAGIGHWFPLRIAVPRELVIVTLRSGAGPKGQGPRRL